MIGPKLGIKRKRILKELAPGETPVHARTVPLNISLLQIYFADS
jgi:hypothetical protein